MGIDAYVRERLAGAFAGRAALKDAPVPDRSEVSDEDLLALLDAQLSARHVDLYARVLQEQGEGFYTIGSLGHESNAAVAMALRPTDPALLHYRSAGFYCARAAQVGRDPVPDILRSLMASTDDPISGGRHKVFGHKGLAIIPQTSTIASHLPRAVGLAFAHERAHAMDRPDEWPTDAVVVTSIGDASLNHSTAAGALNAAEHTVHQGIPLPLLLVIEDNGIGISVRTPPGWVERRLGELSGFERFAADGTDPTGALVAARAAADHVRTHRSPAVLHLRTVRFMGHAGSDAEIAYRSQREIEADYARDPLLATAHLAVQRGLLSAEEIADRYASRASAVADQSAALLPATRLATAAEVTEPLLRRDPDGVAASATGSTNPVDPAAREAAFRGRLPENAGGLTLAQAITATLTDLMLSHPGALVLGEDVGVKGGVYGVTRGLRRAFGAGRVFDTLLDEQTILGTALGSALAGFLPIPEIQYLAYVHNAIDQLRGEAATLRFFSNGQYENGMVVRVPGLAYQRGFGGHFHNDNSLAALLDIPGTVVAVPSSAAEAPGLLRTLAGLAVTEGRVGILVEPIALYHSRDLLEPGDGGALAPYPPPPQRRNREVVAGDMRAPASIHADRDEGRLHVLDDSAADTLVVTFGNGVGMTRRAIAAAGVRADVYDLRWLAPLPAEHLLVIARGYASVLVADETRRSGGVSERVLTALVDGGYAGVIRRVTSEDSIIPLGPAAATVLLSETQIADALVALTGQTGGASHG